MTFVEHHSQWALLVMFALLTLESFGLPLPGETALIACSVLASQGSLSIVAVIPLAYRPRSSATTSATGSRARAAARCSSATG